MNRFPSSLRLPVTLFLVGDTAKVLAVLSGQEPPGTCIKGKDCFCKEIEKHKNNVT
jgi:hypothetical protein